MKIGATGFSRLAKSRFSGSIRKGPSRIARDHKEGAQEARAAASSPGPIDDVSAWCAYQLDPTGDVEVLLGAQVEAGGALINGGASAQSKHEI